MSTPRRRIGEAPRPAATASRRRHLIDRAADGSETSNAAPPTAAGASRRKRKPRFVL